VFAREDGRFELTGRGKFELVINLKDCASSGADDQS
jgi:hypothetical protein